jgi:hypothetical protein
MRNFGAQYENGSLNHPRLANERRALILEQAYREPRREFDRISVALLNLTTLVADSMVADAVKDFLDTLKAVHVS